MTVIVIAPLNDGDGDGDDYGNDVEAQACGPW